MTRIFSGTATVTNGDATVVITSGAPLTSANCPDDAPIALNGVSYHVLSRTDTTHLELTRNYVGATGSVAIEIDPLTPDALSVVNVAVLAARVQAQLNVLDKNSQGLFYNLVGATGGTDPAPGNLAFNNATPTSVTELYIDNLDANQRSVNGLIDLWTSGTVVLVRSLATTAYVAYRLPSGVNALTGYYRASAQYVDHDGVLADGEAVSIGWFRVGEGLAINAVGTLAGRATYNTAAAGFVYVSTDGGLLYRKNSATSGDWSAGVPFQGTAGDRGWAPRFAVVADGERRVLQLAGYVGGTGITPTANVGQYVSTGGYTATIASATDIRGGIGATGASGTNGTNGVDGTNGLDGTDPGVIMIWDNGTTDANPGSGVVRANNALTSSATFLYVSKANRPGNNIAAFLATLDDSNSNRKGIITITKSGGGAQVTFDVTGLIDATGYVKVAVVNGAGATFAANDIVSFQFAPAGDRGTDGTGAGNFVTPDTPAIDPTGYLVKFTDATGGAGATAGILASDVPLKSQNLADVGNRTTANDNLHVNGADIASAATVNLETATGAFVEVTGTVTTTAITLFDGHQRLVRAAAAWPLTHGTNLQIQGGASYTCAAGDMLLFQADGAVIRVTVFRIDGTATKAGPFADQAKAEAGVDNATLMTPLRTMQAIQAQFGIGQGIARWKTAQRNTRLYYGGLAQTGTGLVDGSTSAAGRTFAIDKASRRIRQDGFVKTVKFTLYTLGSASLVGLLKFKVLRKSGTIYTLVSESELITPAAVTTRQTVQLATPMACQPGDVVALWIKGAATGNPGLASASSTGDLLRFIAGETLSSTWTDIADFGIDLQFEGQPPLIVSTGDSIIDGQNTANPWQGHYGTGPAGDLNSAPMNAVRAAIAGLEYEDFAQGGSTWAGVATKTAAIAAVGASAVLAACGVNDVAAGRTWTAIKADMDTLLNGLPVGTKLFICEVMPWSNGTDAQAVALRALNVNYAAWCVDTGATLIRTHDAMGQVRVSTGQLDDLKTSYNYDGTHLTTSGVAALALLLATGLRSILWI